jgi:transposase-like protein
VKKVERKERKREKKEEWCVCEEKIRINGSQTFNFPAENPVKCHPFWRQTF